VLGLFLEVKGWGYVKNDNNSDICEPTVYIQWESRRLPILRALMFCYKDRFISPCTITPTWKSDNKIIIVNTRTVTIGFQWFNIDLLLGTCIVSRWDLLPKFTHKICLHLQGWNDRTVWMFMIFSLSFSDAFSSEAVWLYEYDWNSCDLMEVLFRHLPWRTEESNENLQLQQLISYKGFKPSPCLIRITVGLICSVNIHLIQN
jgi:hypothetical protein